MGREQELLDPALQPLLVRLVMRHPRLPIYNALAWLVPTVAFCSVPTLANGVAALLFAPLWLLWVLLMIGLFIAREELDRDARDLRRALQDEEDRDGHGE